MYLINWTTFNNIVDEEFKLLAANRRRYKKRFGKRFYYRPECKFNYNQTKIVYQHETFEEIKILFTKENSKLFLSLMKIKKSLIVISNYFFDTQASPPTNYGWWIWEKIRNFN